MLTDDDSQRMYKLAHCLHPTAEVALGRQLTGTR
jgi:hypothetical protein